jgi:hypothetical protein
VLQAFDAYLAERELRLEAVVIGGAALNLLGVVQRTTRDCDILYPSLPPAVVEAARDFAARRRSAGDSLADDWLNNGPESLAALLPAGWQDRLVEVFRGEAIILRCLGRLDLLRSKLFSLCDRATDLFDRVALAPTAAELQELRPWLVTQDAAPEWPEHVRAVLEDLARRCGHGLQA